MTIFGILFILYQCIALRAFFMCTFILVNMFRLTFGEKHLIRNNQYVYSAYGLSRIFAKGPMANCLLSRLLRIRIIDHEVISSYLRIYPINILKSHIKLWRSNGKCCNGHGDMVIFPGKNL